MAKTTRPRRPRWTGRLLLVLGLIGLVLIGAAVAIGIYVYQEQHETLTPEQRLEIGKNHLRLQDWALAYSNLTAAVEERPDDPEYLWPAARAAARVGQAVEAIDYARRTWENGKRDTDVLLMRVSLLSGNEEANLAQAREWLAELPESEERSEAKARILIRFNELEEARDTLEALLAKTVTPEWVGMLARVYISLGEGETALELLRAHREAGNLDQVGYNTLMALLAVQANITEIRDLAEEAHLKGYDSDPLRLQYGLVLLGWREGETALEELDPLANGYRLRLQDFSNLQGFLATLPVAEEPMPALLFDALPVEMQETLRTFEMGDDESEVLEPDFLNPMIQHLRAAIASDAFADEAFLGRLDISSEVSSRLLEGAPPADEALLRRQIVEATLGEYVQHHVLDLVAHQARLGISLYRAAQQNADAIRTLRSWAVGDGRALEGERLFYNYILLAIDQKEGRRELLERARALLEDRGVPTIFAAREALHAGEAQQAFSLYRRVFVQEPLLARGPLITMETASALAAAGEEREALALVYVLMQRGAYNRRIFEMIRDLEEDPERREAAMETLRNMYPDDPTVRAAEVLTRVRTNDLDAAQSTLEELMEEYPEDENFEVMRLMVFVEKGEYETAIAEAEASDADPVVLAPVLARAYTRLDRFEEAREQYRIGLDAREGEDAAPLALEFANLLLTRGEFDQAEPLYKQALQTFENSPVAHLGLATIAMQKGDLEAARPHVEAVVESDARVAYAYFLQAQLDLAAQNLTAAVANVERALNITTDYPAAELLRSNILLRMGRLREAERGLTRFLSDMPDHLTARGQLAVVKARMGKYDEALAIVNEVLEEQPENATLRLFTLELLLMAERPAEAREALAAVRDSIPEPLARIHESTILQQEGKPGEAIALLEPHLDDQRTLLQWATYKIFAGEPAEVWQTLAERELPWQAWTRIAGLANQRGQNRLAALAYNKALQQREDDPVLLNNFAWSALLAKNIAPPENIVMAAKRAYELMPEEMSILDTYVTVLGTLEMHGELADLVEGKETRISDRPRILLYGARALAATGDVDGAVELYEGLLAIDEDPWPLNVSREQVEEELEDVRGAGTPPAGEDAS